MKNNPRITIITIAFNSASTIERTIKSVVEQNYQNKEYIIIDGDSIDGTQHVIEKYRDKIDVFVSEKDKGISDAFNKGIKLATGDIIACINSNDYLLPDALTKVAKLYDEEHDLFSGNLLLWDPDTDKKRIIHPSLKFPTLPFFCRPVHQGQFITKHLYEQLGNYDIKLHWAMDLDLLMRATKAGARFKALNIEVGVFMLGGITNESIFKKKNEYLYLIRKNGGSALQAYFYYYFLVVTQTTRKLLKLTGIDIVRQLRYKKA